jgi:hypothetical protein
MFSKKSKQLQRIKYTPICTILKTCSLFAVAMTTMLVTSCTKIRTNFTEYRGSSVIEGKGGTIRVVDGIDFWENGEPDRKYKIIGVIDDYRGEGLISRLVSRDVTIANMAREKGGDAVIIKEISRELKSVDVETGAVNYKSITKVEVVQYVP